MSDYISRERVMDALLHEQYGYLFEDAVRAIPAADVREARRGKWEDTMFGWLCTNCHEEQQFTKHLKYCPNCGALMEEQT